MAIEIVDFPIKNGDFPWQNVSSPEGISFIVNIGDGGSYVAYFMASNVRLS